MDCLSEYISRVLTDQSWCARATKRHAQVVQLLLYLTPAAFYVLCMYVMLANMKRNSRVTDFLPLLSILGQAARCLWMILGSKPRAFCMWADVWGVNFHFGDGQGSQLSNVKLRFNWFNGFWFRTFSIRLLSSSLGLCIPPFFSGLCVTFPVTQSSEVMPGNTRVDHAGGPSWRKRPVTKNQSMRHLGEFWKESLWLIDNDLTNVGGCCKLCANYDASLLTSKLPTSLLSWLFFFQCGLKGYLSTHQKST